MMDIQGHEGNVKLGIRFAFTKSLRKFPVLIHWEMTHNLEIDPHTKFGKFRTFPYKISNSSASRFPSWTWITIKETTISLVEFVILKTVATIQTPPVFKTALTIQDKGFHIRNIHSLLQLHWTVMASEIWLVSSFISFPFFHYISIPNHHYKIGILALRRVRQTCDSFH